MILCKQFCNTKINHILLYHIILNLFLFIFTVETCKPHLLRKKLFQCSNLLEIVKFLVTYVDVNRLHAQECTTEKIRYSIKLLIFLTI